MRLIFNKIWQFKLPVMLVGIIIFAAAVGPHLGHEAQSGLYTISLVFKELLVFVLPFIIFSLILSSIAHLKQGAIRLIVILLPLMCLSNWLSIWIGYGSGSLIVNKFSLADVANLSTRNLEPLFNFAMPTWVSTKAAMALAMVFGLASSWLFADFGQRVSHVCSKITAFILTKLVIRFLPVMILGYAIKIQYDDMLEALVNHYTFIFLAVTGILFAYVSLLYVVVNKFKIREWWPSMRNMFPPVITGLSTLSSAAAMPLTLIAVRKNVHNPDVANFVIPTTVNFHHIGDVIAMTIFSIAVMATYNYPIPSPMEFFAFSFYYMLGRFSVAGIPGGGFFVLIPLLTEFFGFTPVMLGLVQTLNLMFDAIITGVNIFGNGVFAILFNKIYDWTKKCRCFKGRYAEA